MPDFASPVYFCLPVFDRKGEEGNTLLAPASRPPLTVEITRGFAVESSHAVHAIVMDGQENIQAAYGDTKKRVFPRSSIKPLQAVALIKSGAADAFGFSDAEIALACASHSGEEKHVTRVARLLGRLGLDDTALECGAHAPYAAPQDKPCLLCNNCSGKHAGMLALALHLKAPVRGYTDPRHPAQEAILAELSRLCGDPLTPGVLRHRRLLRAQSRDAAGVLGARICALHARRHLPAHLRRRDRACGSRRRHGQAGHGPHAGGARPHPQQDRRRGRLYRRRPGERHRRRAEGGRRRAARVRRRRCMLFWKNTRWRTNRPCPPSAPLPSPSSKTGAGSRRDVLG